MSIKCLNYTVAWQLVCQLTILGMCAGERLCESVHPLVITLYARLYCLLQSLCAFPYIASLYSAVFECGVSLLQLPALDRTHKQQCVRKDTRYRGINNIIQTPNHGRVKN